MLSWHTLWFCSRSVVALSQRLMPLLSFGLHALKAVNGIASLARMFLGTPQLPHDLIDDAERLLSRVCVQCIL